MGERGIKEWRRYGEMGNKREKVKSGKVSKLTKYIIIGAATAAGLFVVWYFSNIVIYILISAVLAIIGKPLVDSLIKIRLKEWRFPRWLASLITILSLWTVTLLFFYFFIPLIFNKISELSQFDATFIVDAFRVPLQSAENFLEHFFSINREDLSLTEELKKQLTPMFNIDVIQSGLHSIVSLVSGTVITLFSITFITFFFLKEENLFRNMVIALFPEKYNSNITHALESITNLLIRYFTGILAQSAIIMILLSTVFMIWGFSAETALFMGVVMGILNVIPYIGPLIGGAICVVVGAVSPLDGYTIGSIAVIIIGTIVAVKIMDDFIFQPILYSNRVKAHPLEIFIVILIAGSVAGVLGMLLAIPLYTVLRVFAKEFFYNFHLVQKLTENI